VKAILNQKAFGRLSPVAWGATALVLLYAGFYLGDPATPGNRFDACCIKGWIGWTDQGLYYASAAAFATGNLESSQHWYPLGYALLAAPFGFLRSHRFFLVDLACLMITYRAFLAFARRAGLSAIAAVVIFLLTICLDPRLFKQWAIPWNTSPAAAAIWTLLAVGAAHLQGRRRPFLLGVLACAIPAFRPTDAIIGAVCLSWLAAADLRSSRLRWRDVMLVTAGVGTVALPYAALHLAIYGPRMSSYMLNSRSVGFTLHDPVWRAFVLLIEPRRWFFAGQGLIERVPWLLLGFAGTFTAWRRGGAPALLAACLTAYCLLMLSYVDLLPTGLWRYFNIHYFKWTLPGFGLLAWLLVRDLRGHSRLAWGALAIVLMLSCVRVIPRPAAPNEAAVAVDIPGPPETEKDTTMTPSLAAVDAVGLLQNVTVMRAFPLPGGDGVRLIGLRRDLQGDVRWAEGHGLPMPANPLPQQRWAEKISFGYPCWLPPHPCKKEPRRE